MQFSNTKEDGLESIIVNWLVNQNDYEQGTNIDYNRDYAIDETRLFRFLQDTQPDALEKLGVFKGCCYWAFSHRVLRLAGSLSSGDWTMRRERRVYQASEQAQRYAAGSNLFQRVL